MSKLFGTDGVRGVANVKLTADLALALGRAAGRLVGPGGRVFIGRDTRVSGPMLEGGLIAGLNSVGAHAVTLGIVPTPAVSHAVRTSAEEKVLGAVVSASHNPAEDNGIKFFGPDGRKIADADEARLEAEVGAPWSPGGAVGSTTSGGDAVKAYADWLVSLAGGELKGLKIAMDCANGAAYALGPEVFRRCGADVIAAHVDATGETINRHCGATHPATIARLTRESGASVGVAFDGDADRAIFSTGDGDLINGDRVIGLAALAGGHTDVVGTVMSNGGYEAYLKSKGVTLHRADVGDKYVVRMMDERGIRVGGEQSGHIVFGDHSPTGDGLLTAIMFLKALKAADLSAAQAYAEFANWPQLLVNVSVESKDGWHTAIASELAEAEAMLQGRGRVNVRPSGTQPMLRVMTEAQEIDLRDRASRILTRALETKLGGRVLSQVDLTHALGD